jgi:hypothetical protein
MLQRCHAPKVRFVQTVPVSVQETYTMIHIHFIISFEFLFSAGSHWPCVINLPVNRDRDARSGNLTVNCQPGSSFCSDARFWQSYSLGQARRRRFSFFFTFVFFPSDVLPLFELTLAEDARASSSLPLSCVEFQHRNHPIIDIIGHR